MQTAPNTPLEIFNMPQYLEIPLFQRPYVWNLEDQWEPLWHDVRRLAEIRLSSPGQQARHFLGAVVFQALPHSTGGIPTSQVIDGQQRLTTLQVVFDAASSIFTLAGDVAHSQQLRNLTHNDANYVPPGSQLLKLKHSNKDAVAFHEVMEAEPPIDYESLKHRSSRIASAHEFFADRIARWLGDSSSPDFRVRAEALTRVLDSGLQVVTITLAADENSQEIFETLNARGTPLTAADLIKNFVFQRLSQEGADTAHAYEQIWPFDIKFWEGETTVGPYRVSRSSLYLNQWLTSRLGEEVSPQATFTRFKSFMDHDANESMKQVLTDIRDQAETYRRWWENAETRDQALDAASMCFYRMIALDTQALKPLLIWLHSPNRRLSQDVIDATIKVAESWVMRRAIVRQSFSELARVVADLIRGLSGVPEEEVPRHVENRLALYNTAATYWPGDEEVRRVLEGEAVYKRFPRKRLRAILEATENAMRSETGGAQVTRWELPIEHVLPQSWQDHWPVEDLAAQLDRTEHVHRFGNLTLLTTALNSRVSNGAWPTKVEALAKHDTLLLNSRMVAEVRDETWDESRIDARSRQLADWVMKVWPVPAGHQGEVVDARATAAWKVSMRDLVFAGALDPGAVLEFRRGEWTGRTAVVRDDGLIEVEGQLRETPSGAAHAITGRSNNGWKRWFLQDGRRLDDLRAAYMGKSRAAERQGFDWSTTHAILAAMPEGRWTTYGALAEAVGTAPQPLANHVATCLSCEGAFRVLASDGRIAEGFAWTNPQETRDPKDVLKSEGISFDGDVADPARRDTAADLLARVSGEARP